MRYENLSAIFLALFLVTIPYAFAQTDYVGGYLSTGKSSTSKVIFATNFPNTDPSVIPTNNVLQSVISVAGGQNNAPSGMIYQGSIELYHDGSVQYWPQWHLGDSWNNGGPWTVGTVNSICFYSEIIIGGGQVTFKAFVYNTMYQYDHNTPTIYQWSLSVSDTQLLYGTEIWMFKNQYFFQSGVECKPPGINSPNWTVYQFCWSYYDGSSWRYTQAYSVEGSLAVITHYQGTTWKVGGADFTGVNLLTPITPDNMKWKYTGTSIGSGVKLWPTGGTVTPYPTGV